jgi:hypothetical protein
LTVEDQSIAGKVVASHSFAYFFGCMAIFGALGGSGLGSGCG